jgi:F420-non-reducing hydrogenase iron-sulfur subunit
MTANDDFEPRILGFLCICCAYAGADLAGVSRFQYPPNHRTVMVRCSGRIDPLHVLRGFLDRADAVMVLGCHPGDCHYAVGNYYARVRIQALKHVLSLTGMNPERLLLDWVSASEGKRFANLVADYTEKIRALGPPGQDERLPWETLRQGLLAATHVMGNDRVRWLIGRKLEMLEKGDVYQQPADEKSYDALLQSTITTEYLRGRLLLLAEDRPRSVKELAEETGLAARLVLSQVVALEQAGLMSMTGIEGRSPKYLRAG